MLESPTKKVFYLAGDIISSVSPAHINMQRILLAFDSRAQYQRRNINLHVSAPRLVAVNHIAVVPARLICDVQIDAWYHDRHGPQQLAFDRIAS